MAKKQSRRSISVRGSTYARLKALAEKRNALIENQPDDAPRPENYDRWSCSNIVEQLIVEACEVGGVVAVEAPQKVYPRRSVEECAGHGGHFTF